MVKKEMGLEVCSMVEYVFRMHEVLGVYSQHEEKEGGRRQGGVGEKEEKEQED